MPYVFLVVRLPVLNLLLQATVLIMDVAIRYKRLVSIVL
jgi:hypothetical protein